MIRLHTVLPILLLSASGVCGAEDKSRALTLKEAHEIALQKHPKISVAELKALAAKQVVKEIRSNTLPTISANIGAAVADQENTKVVSGILPVSTVLNRASGSILVSQLITDFGRTSHLTESARLKAGAEERNIEATRLQILLQVDGAYVGALQAESLVHVAEETVRTRQLLRDQISTLAKNQLKSELDASFAEVNYQEALLLLSKTQNDLQSAFASLAALLDEPETAAYHLADIHEPGELPSNVSDLISLAVQNRPDLQRLRMERESTSEFAKAEAALNRPTLSVQGTAGVLPWRDPSLRQDYAAAGIVLSWPIFTGGLNTARRKEADLRAQAAVSAVHDEENNAIRDVRLVWLAASNAIERIGITAKLLEQARRTLDLAQARYDAGATSIVELSQSQLNLTAAEITHTNARHEYLIRRSLLDYQTGALH